MSHNKTSMGLTYKDVAHILENFLTGKGHKWEWDDFVSGMKFNDGFLKEIQDRCLGLPEEFPPSNPREYCNEQGRAVIRSYIKQLRASK